MDYLSLCYSISETIKSQLYTIVRDKGFTGESLQDRHNLKSTHFIDIICSNLVTEILTEFNCNIFIESVNSSLKPDADFSIYIDPIDGSLNWERGVGDPSVVIAISNKSQINCLNDFTFSFVFGLRSQDVYYSDSENAYYVSSISKNTVTIKCHGHHNIADATAYLRTGYGAAQQQLDHSLLLYTAVRDIRGFDNAAMEICEIARDAADVLVEARGISDFFNLLAYPILKSAGGYLTDLNGIDLGQQTINIDSIYNFIACNNKPLLTEVLNKLR